MTSVLITGGSGFIGTNLVEHYRKRGDRVTNLDVAPPRNPEHAACWRKTDILDREELKRAVAEAAPEIVFHMAARTDLEGDSLQDYSANTDGVANLIAVLRELKALRFVVFASSMLVCRIGHVPSDEADYCPNTHYGESKVAGERLVRETAGEHFPWIIVRPTSIWGPWFDVPYRSFFTVIQRGLYVHPKGRRVRRSYGFVLNAVFQLEKLAETNGGGLLGRTIYLADYEPIELKSWADMIQDEFGLPPLREMPLWLFRIAAKTGDMFKCAGYAYPPMSTFRLTNMLTEMVHDTAPLRLVCGDASYTVEEGVRITCDWIRKNPQN